MSASGWLHPKLARPIFSAEPRHNNGRTTSALIDVLRLFIKQGPLLQKPWRVSSLSRSLPQVDRKREEYRAWCEPRNGMPRCRCQTHALVFCNKLNGILDDVRSLETLPCSTTRTVIEKRSCLYKTHCKSVVEIKCDFFTKAVNTTKSRMQPRCSAFSVAQISRCILGMVNSASILTATLALSACTFFGVERVHQSGGSSALARVYFKVFSVFSSQRKPTPWR